MFIWQVDFYRFSGNSTEIIWNLSICDANGDFRYKASCPQSEANSTWLTSQFKLAGNERLPDKIQVFRPQSLSLVELAASHLNISVEATRRTDALKLWLQAEKYATTVEKLPPMPLPEKLWGEKWQFATFPAGGIVDEFSDRLIPILDIPDYLQPINLGIASTTAIPGVIIYGGRQSMQIARWLKQVQPVSLNYIAGAPDGLILEAGLADRWVIATFEDSEVTIAAKNYQSRQQQSHGLHFLLIQPDDSGMTYSGFWLLQ
ncbi:Tab2/Atab2 family RNA-binding protein [Calothrix sp. PCC 6303]|uniref:Tab2/Atab2 family RNA-binding protein n=1 Tax=Calothrix sp. PCC 6303 TaxID=1170562 RepID=UPI0002A0432E|nr:Tab2/Atab2 family RNA-binding protein [Calothrix sp. PCC 6303]AFZ03312.1 protein of unknown function DUF1092 [Calothrix sp. PCC 6303]